MDWSKYDNLVNADELNKDVDELGNNNFEELPDGNYEVAFDSAELKPTKNDGHPMVAIQLTVVHGKYENRKIFINQVLIMNDANDKYRVKTCNELLRGFKSSVPVAFTSVADYAKLVSKIEKECVDCEYLISKKSRVAKNGKSYSNYEVLKAY